MKIVSWNINALKAHENAFRYAVDLLQPGTVCLGSLLRIDEPVPVILSSNGKSR